MLVSEIPHFRGKLDTNIQRFDHNYCDDDVNILLHDTSIENKNTGV